MKYTWGFLILFLIGTSTAQNYKYLSQDVSIDSIIDGTLLLPKKHKQVPLAIIIQGSGPTDRNGNQKRLKNNSLKFLAEELSEKNIASYRYDKRLVKQILEGTFKESDANFNDFIDDAKKVVSYFKDDSRFSELIIIGHSQGSLVGMIAAKDKAVSKYISLAGAGQEIDDVVIDQLKKQASALVENARLSFDDLRVNGIARNFDTSLASIFRQSIQPFMYSWMQYNPQTEIAKLNIPVLIINGDKDLQVQVSEAEKLKEAKPEAKLVIIHNMNHILKNIEGNFIENQQAYNKEDLPVIKELISIINNFITKQ